MKINFPKTGNFWFDSAIISLYSQLTTRQSRLKEEWDEEVEKIDISIAENGDLILEGSEEALLSELDAARMEVSQKYLRNTQNFGWIYKDRQFAIYRKMDFQQALKSFFTGKTGRPQHGALKFPKKEEEVGKIGFMTREQQERFIHFREGHSEKKLADKGYLEAPPLYEFGESYSTDFEKTGKYACIFSGRKVKKAENVTGLNYPFLTGTSGEINFASNLSAGYKLSSKMAFLSLFAFDNLYYQLPDADSGHYFMIGDENIKSLSIFNSFLQNNFNSEEDWRSNFKNKVIGTTYPQEALLGFLLSMYAQIRDRQEELLEEVLTKKVYTFSKDKGIFRDVQSFNALHKLFDLFDAFHYDHFLFFFRNYFEKQGKKYNTVHRDKLASTILCFQSFNRVVEAFLGTVKLGEKRGLPYLNEIVEIYNSKIVRNMDSEKIKLCRDLGRTIGIFSADSKNRRLLYALRNARNRNDFLKVLSDSQFRIADYYKQHKQATKSDVHDDVKAFVPGRFYIKPEFFEHLPENREWEEYKSLVSIFAMNYYLINQKEETNGQSNE